MEQDVNAFAAALEDDDAWDWQHSLQQLEGRFRFLDGIYRAHSEVRGPSFRHAFGLQDNLPRTCWLCVSRGLLAHHCRKGLF